MRPIAEQFKINPGYFDLRRTVDVSTLIEKWKHKPESVVLPELYVGIEIEVENIRRQFNDAFGVWTYKADGSLRNSGMEWVSNPICGQAIVAALWEWFELNAAYNPKASFSPRTSIHVHMDVRALSMQEVIAIVLTYLAVEPLLYKFVGEDRDKNIYCVPLYETQLVNNFVNYLNSQFSVVNTEHGRYSGLNLDSLKKFGTIEFRQLGGTDDVAKIIRWINLLMSIYNFGISSTLSHVIEEISALNTNSFYIAFCNNVFGPYVQHLDLTSVKIDLEKGVKAVKQSTIANKFFRYLKDHKDETSKGYMNYHYDDDYQRATGARFERMTPEQIVSAMRIEHQREAGNPEIRIQFPNVGRG